MRPSILAVLSVDDQLELARLHDRQVRRLRALEDAADIDADLTICIRNVAFRSSSARRPRQSRAFEDIAGTTWRAARGTSWTRRLLKKASPPTKSASGRSRANVAKAASISRLVLALQHLDLQSHGAGSRLHVSQRALGSRGLVGLTSTATRVAAGTSSRRSSSRFAVNSPLKKLIPVTLPPGRARLATRPSLTGSSPTTKTMGIVVVAALAASAAGVADGGDHGDLPANQIGRQRRQPIELIFGPAVFDRHVLALDIAGLLQALAEAAQTVRSRRQAMRR